MENFTLVRPEHLNHHGYLFGGVLLKWVDEYAWLVAALDFTGCSLVTVGMDAIAFRKRVEKGSILRFSILPLQIGTTSVRYSVDIYADAPGARSEEHVFSTTITFVNLDEDGVKRPLPRPPRLRSSPTTVL
jgi:acyl-CoA hydrolase